MLEIIVDVTSCKTSDEVKREINNAYKSKLWMLAGFDNVDQETKEVFESLSKAEAMIKAKKKIILQKNGETIHEFESE